MANGTKHEVIECGTGVKNLRRALAEIDASDKRLIAIVPDTGGGFMNAVSGGVVGLMLVVATDQKDQ